MDFRPPRKFRSYLKIGACSWKYDAWKGLIYEVDAPMTIERFLETLEAGAPSHSEDA